MNELEKWILEQAKETLAKKQEINSNARFIHVPFMTINGVINMAIFDCVLKRYTCIEYPKLENGEIKRLKFKL